MNETMSIAESSEILQNFMHPYRVQQVLMGWWHRQPPEKDQQMSTLHLLEKFLRTHMIMRIFGLVCLNPYSSRKLHLIPCNNCCSWLPYACRRKDFRIWSSSWTSSRVFEPHGFWKLVFFYSYFSRKMSYNFELV